MPLCQAVILLCSNTKETIAILKTDFLHLYQRSSKNKILLNKMWLLDSVDWKYLEMLGTVIFHYYQAPHMNYEMWTVKNNTEQRQIRLCRKRSVLRRVTLLQFDGNKNRHPSKMLNWYFKPIHYIKCLRIKRRVYMYVLCCKINSRAPYP